MEEEQQGSRGAGAAGERKQDEAAPPGDDDGAGDDGGDKDTAAATSPAGPGPGSAALAGPEVLRGGADDPLDRHRGGVVTERHVEPPRSPKSFPQKVLIPPRHHGVERGADEQDLLGRHLGGEPRRLVHEALLDLPSQRVDADPVGAAAPVEPGLHAALRGLDHEAGEVGAGERRALMDSISPRPRRAAGPLTSREAMHAHAGLAGPRDGRVCSWYCTFVHVD